MKLTESMLRKIIKEEIGKSRLSPVNESASIPGNVMKFAKERGSYAVSLVKKVAGWANKVGRRIDGGTAIGKGYNTLVLDMKYNAGEIRINLEDETIKLYNVEVNSLSEFRKVFNEKNPTKENLDYDPSTLNEDFYIPDRIMKFAKEKGPHAVSLLRKVTEWVEEVGKQIEDGTAIGRGYNTLILDMSRDGGEISIDLDDGIIRLYGKKVASLSEFRKVFNEKVVKENLDYDPLGDGGHSFVGTGEDGRPRRNKENLIQSGKYYILDQRESGQYEFSAGPFDHYTEAYRDTLNSYDRYTRSKLRVVRGTYGGRADVVDTEGRSIEEIPSRKILDIHSRNF